MGYQQIGKFRGRAGQVTRDEFFRKPVVFYDKVTFEWADNRIVIEDGTIKGFTAISGSDIYSSNWDGAIPADLSGFDNPDLDASAGFYLDASAGAAQWKGSLYVGGNDGFDNAEYLLFDDDGVIFFISRFQDAYDADEDASLAGSLAFQSSTDRDGVVLFYGYQWDTDARPWFRMTSHNWQADGSFEIGFGSLATPMLLMQDDMAGAQLFYMDGDVLPGTDSTWDLGSSTKGWRNMYLGATGWLYFDGGTVSFVGHDGNNLHLRNSDGGGIYIDQYNTAGDIYLRAKDGGGAVRNRLVIDGNDDMEVNWHNGTALFYFTESGAYTPALYAHGESKHRFEFDWQNSGTWQWRMVINNILEFYLGVSGLVVPNVYSNTTGSAANVYVDSGGLLYRSTSTEMWKEEIEPYPGDFHDVLKLDSIYFWPMAGNPTKGKYPERHGTKKLLSLSHENTLEHFPVAVGSDDVDYNAVVSALLEVVKEQDDRLQAIENRLTNCPHCGKLDKPATHGEPHATE